MSAPDRYQWRRDKDGLGVWEHRGKVAVAGVGHSPVDRRWDGVSMDKTLGAYSILACQKAMDEAGVTPDQIDGVICCDSHIAGGSGGSASQWAPRPYFAPPYDSEWGLTLVNAKWLIEQMGLPNVKFAPTGVPTISEMVGMAAQAVGDGVCSTCLVIYPTGNLEGRYRRGGENADDYARGARQWTAPWGNHGGNDFINMFPHGQYCLKYGGKHDDLAPFVINQHRNGLLTPWGYNATHKVPQLTIEDYLNSRYVLNPLRLWDCDRPVNASAAYLFTTAERARDMRQPPVYVLNHSQHNFRQRTTQADLERDRGLDRPRRQENVRGCRAWARGRRYIQSLRRLCTHDAVLPGGLPVARRQTRRCLRVLRGRYQGRGTAPALLERRQSGERAHPYGHVHRLHRAAPRHGWRTAGQGSGRDRAGGIHHAKQWRLDHVRQTPELRGCDTGDHRLAAITLSRARWAASPGSAALLLMRPASARYRSAASRSWLAWRCDRPGCRRYA